MLCLSTSALGGYEASKKDKNFRHPSKNNTPKRRIGNLGD